MNLYIPIGYYCKNLLWSDWVVGRFLEQIEDVVVVDFDVGDEDGIAAVLVHPLCPAAFLWVHHVRKLRVHLLPEQVNAGGETSRSTREHQHPCSRTQGVIRGWYHYHLNTLHLIAYDHCFTFSTYYYLLYFN